MLCATSQVGRIRRVGITVIVAASVILGGCSSSDDSVTSDTDSVTSDTDSVTWSSGTAELRVGDCFTDNFDTEDLDLDVVSCSEAHDGEVFAINRDDFGVEDRDAQVASVIAAYAGIEPSEVEGWLTENGLRLLSNWNIYSGFLHFLTPEEGQGQLTTGYRATDR